MADPTNPPADPDLTPRDLKRYPSATNGWQAAKPDRPASGRAAPAPGLTRAEEIRLKANVRAPAPVNDAEVEAKRLANRYPSLNLAAKDPTPESAGVRPDPTLRARPPASAEKSGQTVAELALDAPEGFDAASPLFREFRVAAGELGLDQGKAGRLLELHRKALASQDQARVREVEAWRKATESDPEVLEGIPAAKGLLERHGDADLLAMLEESGYGNHPGLAKFLVRVAKDLEAARGGRGSR